MYQTLSLDDALDHIDNAVRCDGDDYDCDMQSWLAEALEFDCRRLPVNIAIRAEWFEREIGVLVALTDALAD